MEKNKKNHNFKKKVKIQKINSFSKFFFDQHSVSNIMSEIIIGDMPKTVIFDISPMTVFGISPMTISNIIFENENFFF